MFRCHVVLFEPEIPQNTGNIVRTCAAVGARLHLIEPLGFSLEDRYLKRAGLDYWDRIEITRYPDFSSFASRHTRGSFNLLTKRGRLTYDRIDFSGEVYLIFGRETEGLPESLLRKYPDRCFRIPMLAAARSLNLSNAVAIVVFEAYRQNGFTQLQIPGRATGED